MYRKQDLQFLQDIFDRSSNEIAVLYGSVENGLSEIVSDFIKDKECVYYRAAEVCETVQKELFAAEFHEQTRSPVLSNEDYEKLIGSYINDQSDRKKLIVFDEFQYLVRDNPTFINFITDLLFDKSRPDTAMYLLVCDDISWIEKDMIRLTGRKAYEIAGVIKLKDYSPTELSESFPKMAIRDLIAIYSVLGGRSLYYNMLFDGISFREVVLGLLEKYNDRFFDTDMYLPKDIREPQLYNSILIYLAAGTGKLGDIHDRTQVDRAKLSVYIKVLIEKGIVEKAGTAFYRIKDNLVRFYYRFVYPHFSSLAILGADRFYRKYIEHDIFGFIEDIYPKFCMEHIRWLERENRLNFKVASVEEYFDKNGAIDFLIVAAAGSVIACACRYAGPHMSYGKYEEVKSSVRKKKLICDNIWLFSAGGFDQKLSMFGSVTPGVKLIEGTEQRLH